MTKDLDFFKTQMPDTRKADFYLGCLDGSVFLDFNKSNAGLISLRRISFDGYGCCELSETANPLNFEMSQKFLEEIEKYELNHNLLTPLIKQAIKLNKDFIWTNALEEYNLLD